MSNQIITQLVSIATDDLAQTLADELPREELIEFIKMVDSAVADWDFTLKLCEYFEEQELEYVKEISDNE